MKALVRFSVLLLPILVPTLVASAQESVFSDPAVDYSFTLPEPKWKLTVRPNATNNSVEFVYGDRTDCHLQVRRISVPSDTLLAQIIEEEEQRLQIRPGFVAGREENFNGKLRGAVFNFEYLASGRNMAGRFYFLRSNENTVYVLRFTGNKDVVRSLRNQLDSIARSFAAS